MIFETSRIISKILVLGLILLSLLGLKAGAENFPAVEVYEKTSKAVVLIYAQDEKFATSIGSGSLILNDGLIVTNAHVIMDDKTSKPYESIRVHFRPAKVTGSFNRDLKDWHQAKLVAYDTNLDLAILKAQSIPASVIPITLANADEMRVGEEVVAIGHPEQGGLWSLTYGRISGMMQSQNNFAGKDVFQTDASINRGNSGGPLLDRRGYLVGVNTNVARIALDKMAITGVNFAVKSTVVNTWLSKQGIRVAYGTAPLRVTERSESIPEKPATVPEKEKPLKLEPPITKPVEPPAKTEPQREVAEPKKELPKEIIEPKVEKPQDKTVSEPQAKPKTDEKQTMPEDRILTPKRPYQYEDLIKAVERDLEDMMEDMRGKIRRVR